MGAHSPLEQEYAGYHSPVLLCQRHVTVPCVHMVQPALCTFDPNQNDTSWFPKSTHVATYFATYDAGYRAGSVSLGRPSGCLEVWTSQCARGAFFIYNQAAARHDTI
jgi:hypothetical protein